MGGGGELTSAQERSYLLRVGPAAPRGRVKLDELGVHMLIHLRHADRISVLTPGGTTPLAPCAPVFPRRRHSP